jgi:hypothetical protein
VGTLACINTFGLSLERVDQVSLLFQQGVVWYCSDLIDYGYVEITLCLRLYSTTRKALADLITTLENNRAN